MQGELAVPQTFFYDQVVTPVQTVNSNSENMHKTPYQENLVNTATREELILMLYDGALKFIRRGVYAGQEKDFPVMSYNFLRAQKIIHYLDLSLDMDKGKEVAQNMAKLYDFINRRLSDSLINKQVELVNEVIGIIHTLRQAWNKSFINDEE